MTDRRAVSGNKATAAPLEAHDHGASGAPALEVERGRLGPDVKPNLRAVTQAVGVPFQEWASPDNGHRVLTRAEWVALNKAFIAPLQETCALLHTRQQALERRTLGGIARRLLAWLRAPLHGRS